MYRFPFLMTLAFLTTACGKGELPVMTGSGSRYDVHQVPAASYFELVDAGVTESFPNDAEPEDDYDVQTITVGLSLEPQVGIGSLSVGNATAVDFHFEEAK